jgi:hypothetical protein
MNIHLNNEEQEYKTDPIMRSILGGGRVNREGKEVWIWSMYFIYLCKDRTLQPVESF